MLASTFDRRDTGSTEVQLKPILSHRNLQAHTESRTQDPLGDHPDGDKKGKILATTGTWTRLLRGADDDEDVIHEQYLDETEEPRVCTSVSGRPPSLPPPNSGTGAVGAYPGGRQGSGPNGRGRPVGGRTIPPSMRPGHTASLALHPPGHATRGHHPPGARNPPHRR
jgi:hypothetical protein